MKRLINFLKKIFKRKNVVVYARVYRAKEGKWEDLGIISKGKSKFKVKK